MPCCLELKLKQVEGKNGFQAQAPNKIHMNFQHVDFNVSDNCMLQNG